MKKICKWITSFLTDFYVWNTAYKTEFYKISYIDASGSEVYKTFEKQEYSPQAKLLYNDTEAIMHEYGESLSAEEKRQVLVDIINKVLI